MYIIQSVLRKHNTETLIILNDSFLFVIVHMFDHKYWIKCNNFKKKLNNCTQLHKRNNKCKLKYLRTYIVKKL